MFLELTISFLEKLVEQKHDESGNEELDDDQETDSGTDVAGVSVHAGQDVHDGLAHGDHHPKQLLGSVKQGPVLGSVSHFNELGSGQELHDET